MNEILNVLKSKIARFIKKIYYHSIFWFFWIFFKYLCKGSVIGADYIKACINKGFVIAANHTSYLDWLILYSYFWREHKIRLSFFAKEKVLDHPFWGPALEDTNCIRITNNGKVSKCIKNSELLDNSKYFGIFPEGTRSRDGKIGKGKPGVILLASSKKLPIIPAALNGFYEAWPSNKSFPKVKKLNVVFGDPYFIDCPNLKKSDLVRETDIITSKIKALTEIL